MMKDIFVAVLETTLSTSVIIVLMLLFTPILNRRYAAKWNYWIWIFLALRLLMPFSLYDIVNSYHINTKVKTNEINAMQTSTPVIESSGDLAQIEPYTEQTVSRQRIVFEIPEPMVTPLITSDEKSNSSISLLDICSIIWIGGCLLFMVVHWISYLRYKKLIFEQGTKLEEDSVTMLLVCLSKELCIRQHIYVIVYHKAESPMVIGFFRPMVVLPDMQYSKQELYFILKHELVHLKRKDVCLKLLIIVANAVHWFNPIVWIMQKEAVIDMELSCDERVVQGMDFAGKKAYTETLFAALHRNHVKRTVLSTQFYGGKQIMKQRFQNILGKAHKKNGILVLLVTVLLVVVFGTTIGCSVAVAKISEKGDTEANVPLTDFSKANEEQKTTKVQMKVSKEQKVAEVQTEDNALVPEMVRQKVQQLVENTFLYEKQLSTHYIDWRVVSVKPSYTYENFEGMTLQIYQFNFEFLTNKPDEIEFLEGMRIDANGWVVTGGIDSNYLIYQQTEDALVYVRHIFETEYVPGDKEFTEELQYLYNMGEFLPDASLQGADAMLMTFVKEGFPIQDSVVCQNGERYSIYLAEGKWMRTNTDEWTARRNTQVKLWVTHFQDKSLDDVEKELAHDGYAMINDNRIRQKGDMIYAAKLKVFDGEVWGVFSTYPIDTGWGIEIRKMADTLSRRF